MSDTEQQLAVYYQCRAVPRKLKWLLKYERSLWCVPDTEIACRLFISIEVH